MVNHVGHTPTVPRTDEMLWITATVQTASMPTQQVMLHYRVMFGGEIAVPMQDDGLHNDGMVGDGIYGAEIPNGETKGDP